MSDNPGVRFTGAVLAAQSSNAFVHELAKLDVRCQIDPPATGATVRGLHDLHAALREEWLGVRLPPAQRRARLGEHLWALATDPREARSAWRGVKQDLPDSIERNLASAVRAVEYELRHLESPAWKRWAAKVPRAAGLPVAARLLDRFGR